MKMLKKYHLLIYVLMTCFANALILGYNTLHRSKESHSSEADYASSDDIHNQNNHLANHICDCGPDSTGCSWYLAHVQKNCTCKSGAAQTTPDQTAYCKVCDCGELSFKCYFEWNVKKCECEGNSREFDGKCIACDCGPNSISCSYDYSGYKSCKCKDGYSYDQFASGICKPCYCGPNSVSCLYDGAGKKSCVCNPGYVHEKSVSMICEKCDCGLHSRLCRFDDNGQQKCYCLPGFLPITDLKDVNVQACQKSSPVIPGWQVALYVVSAVIFTVLVIVLLVCYRKRRMRND